MLLKIFLRSQPCLRRLMSTRTKAVELELFQSALPKVIDILGKCKKFEPLPEMKESLEEVCNFVIQLYELDIIPLRTGGEQRNVI